MHFSEIHAQALEISIRYRQSEAELIDVLDQIDRHKVYLHQDCSSLFQYVVKKLNLSESVAYNLISVMRKAREVPLLKTELAKGNITQGLLFESNAGT